MGNTLSENLVSQTTNTFVKVANKVALDTAIGQNCSNVISFIGCKNIHDIKINQKMNCWIHQETMQTASQDASASVTDEKLVTQVSETIAQNLDLNPGSKEAINITRLVTNLSIAVSNTISQQCTVSSNNVNSFECANSDNMYNIEVNQAAESGVYSNCVQNSTQVSSAQAALKSAIDQKAKTTVQNAIAACLIAAAVLAVAIGFMYMMKSKGMIGGGSSAGSGSSKIKSFMILIVICLIFWIYVANECNGNIQKIPVVGKIIPHWCKGNKTTPWIVNIIFILIIIAVVYFTFAKKEASAKIASVFRFR